jgi:hypothetical protein
LGGRVQSQIAWAKVRALRDGATLASKKLWIEIAGERRLPAAGILF